jgi:hypothetical protein
LRQLAERWCRPGRSPPIGYQGTARGDRQPLTTCPLVQLFLANFRHCSCMPVELGLRLTVKRTPWHSTQRRFRQADRPLESQRERAHQTLSGTRVGSTAAGATQQRPLSCCRIQFFPILGGPRSG